MNRNFSIKDGVFFELSGQTLDICNLLSVRFYLGTSPAVEMLWGIDRSNQQMCIIFSDVQDLIVKGRDAAYPAESGGMLTIAGFSNGCLDPLEPELYVEPNLEIGYMTFVMADASAILVKAGTASMRRL